MIFTILLKRICHKRPQTHTFHGKRKHLFFNSKKKIHHIKFENTYLTQGHSVSTLVYCQLWKWNPEFENERIVYLSDLYIYGNSNY